ncbi:MAG: hypothetical protein OXI73_15670, partial [Rhodospirillales bacterium]|nr:hypothetical protein [Rhodospirillales bacterium]
MNSSRHLKWLRIAVLASGLWALQSAAQDSADAVFLNGKILTVDEDFSVVQALAVTGNRISAVGSDEQVRS